MNLQAAKYVDKYIGSPLCLILGLFNKHRVINFSFLQNKDIKAILLMKFWGIGNIVMLIPVLKQIRINFPQAKIIFFSLQYNRPILESISYIDEVVTLDAEKLYRFIRDCIISIIYFRKKKFDFIFDFEQFIKISSLFALFIKARFKVGFDTDGQIRGRLYNLSVPYNNNQHMLESFADICRKVGIACKDLKLEKISTPWEVEDRVSLYLNKNNINKDDLLIGMHIGSGDNFLGRRWPKENFARLADILISDYRAKVVFTGSKAEYPLVKETKRLMKINGAISSAGELGVLELIELIKRCHLFFSNDTGPLHIAVSVKTPVVGFFGPNTPRLYGPLGKDNLVFYKKTDCSPCITNLNCKTSYCKDPKCIKSITVEEVIEKVDEFYFKNERLKKKIDESVI